jgi:catechol 2,3-dioxygenase-like lactoylglutathione lyase family enzyme
MMVIIVHACVPHRPYSSPQRTGAIGLTRADVAEYAAKTKELTLMTTHSDLPSAFIKGLFETHLNVANLDRSAHFYEHVLGLQLGVRDEARRLAIYWIGGWGHTFVGLWEKPQDQIQQQHFAFEVDRERLAQSIAALTVRGIAIRNFFGERTDVPSVFGWVPAASVYFDDPDGHILELIAKLPEPPRPEMGIISLLEWNHLKLATVL